MRSQIAAMTAGALVLLFSSPTLAAPPSSRSFGADLNSEAASRDHKMPSQPKKAVKPPSKTSAIQSVRSVAPRPGGNQSKQPAASNASTQPYSLKGIRLGMTLEEFRATRLPGEEANCFPVCSCDRSGELIYNMAGQDIGGLTCEYRERDSKWGDVYARRITIAKIPCELMFNFICDPQGAYRLYEIRGKFDTEAYPIIALSLEERYGKPLKAEDSVTHNKVGTSFPNAKRIWFNGVSSIEVEMRYDTIDKGAIWFTHQALADLRQKRSRDRHGEPSQDL